MPERTIAKVNIKEGTVELEGSEEFVTKYLDEFKGFIGKQELASTGAAGDVTPPIDDTKGQVKAPKKKQRKGKAVQIKPIPIDLKSHDPPFREFYSEKMPRTNQERVTVCVYYINKILDQENVAPGHIVSCYREVNARIPQQIPQLFRDTTHRKGWIAPGEETGSVNVTISGENLVEHDLPRSANAGKGKEAAGT